VLKYPLPAFVVASCAGSFMCWQRCQQPGSTA
jgi:hypothetical protein